MNPLPTAAASWLFSAGAAAPASERRGTPDPAGVGRADDAAVQRQRERASFAALLERNREPPPRIPVPTPAVLARDSSPAAAPLPPASTPAAPAPAAPRAAVERSVDRNAARPPDRADAPRADRATGADESSSAAEDEAAVTDAPARSGPPRPGSARPGARLPSPRGRDAEEGRAGRLPPPGEASAPQAASGHPAHEAGARGRGAGRNDDPGPMAGPAVPPATLAGPLAAPPAAGEALEGGDSGSADTPRSIRASATRGEASEKVGGTPLVAASDGQATGLLPATNETGARTGALAVRATAVGTGATVAGGRVHGAAPAEAPTLPGQTAGAPGTEATAPAGAAFGAAWTQALARATDPHEAGARLPGAEGTGATGTPMAAAHGAAAAGLAAVPPASNPDAAVPLPWVQVDDRMDSPGFTPSLASQVSVLARDGIERAEIRLNPAEMGPVAVQIQIDGAQARVEFTADQAATRSALEQSVPALAAALREAGLTLSGGGVFQHPQGRPGGERGGGDGRQNGSGDGRRGGSRGPGTQAVAAAEPVAHRRLGRTGIDLYA